MKQYVIKSNGTRKLTLEDEGMLKGFVVVRASKNSTTVDLAVSGQDLIDTLSEMGFTPRKDNA